jgi:hypothetical protein
MFDTHAAFIAADYVPTFSSQCYPIQEATKMSLSFFPRQKRESASERAERQKDARERRLDRTEQDLQEREAALRERERNVSRRERAEPEASGRSSEEAENAPFLQRQPGATAPGSQGDVAAFILHSHAVAQGEADNTPLPTDKTARLIAMFARGELPEPERHQPNAIAGMILRADKWRRGEEPL